MKRIVAVAVLLANVAYATATTTEVLVLASAAVALPQTRSRKAVEIQNLGPNAIYCAFTAATAVTTKSRKLDASGGVWALDANSYVTIYCRAVTADQVTGAATIVSEL